MPQIIRDAPSFGEKLGAGFGAGISSGIENLINMKLENLKTTHQKSMLEESLVPVFGREKASFYASVGVKNPRLMDFLMREEVRTGTSNFQQQGVMPGMEQIKQQNLPRAPIESLQPQQKIRPTLSGKKQPVAGKPQKMMNLKKYRLQVLKLKNQSPAAKEKFLSRIAKKGVSPEELEVIASDTLTPNIVRYFLNKSNNNAKNARKLARSFGYKV